MNAPAVIEVEPLYHLEVTEYSLERGGIRRSLYKPFVTDGWTFDQANRRAWHLNISQGLMLLKGPRTHVLTARVVPA